MRKMPRLPSWLVPLVAMLDSFLGIFCPPTVAPFNLAHAVVINMLIPHRDWKLKLDLGVTGALGMELEESLSTYLNFAVFVSVFRVQFCKIMCSSLAQMSTE